MIKISIFNFLGKNNKKSNMIEQYFSAPTNNSQTYNFSFITITENKKRDDKNFKKRMENGTFLGEDYFEELLRIHLRNNISDITLPFLIK